MTWNVTKPDAMWISPRAPHTHVGQEQLWHFDPEPIIREVMDQKIVSIDTETTGLNIVKDMPLYWSMAWGDKSKCERERRICMPADTLHYFREPFKDPNKKWIFANAKYDQHILANVDLFMAGDCIDTQVMHALIYEEQSHKLKDMANTVLGWRWTDFKETFGISEKGDGVIQAALVKMEQTNLAKLVEYASDDAYGTLHLYFALKKELEEINTFSLYPSEFRTMWDIFIKTEMPYTKVLWKCERNGIKINAPYLASISGPVEQEIESIQREITKIAGRMINPNSPQQMVQYFVKELGLQPLKYTKGGKSGIKSPSVDYDFLYHYAPECPAADLMLKFRDLDKLKGTYIDGLRKHMDLNERIHTKFNQDTVRTGRLSSSDPNCFHPDTELLTEEGWKKISECGLSKVAQWAPDGTITFVSPSQFIRQKATELVHVRNQHIRLAVTRDHRCLLRHRKTRELRIFRAEQYPEDWQQIHAGQYIGGDVELGEDFIRLLVATQADGHFDQSGGIDFGFKKERKVVRLLGILTNLRIKYSYKAKNAAGRFHIRIGKESTDVVKECLGPEKKFGSWLLRMTRENLEIFCEEVFHWDGSWTRMNSYSSDVEENARWVQTAFALIGKRSHFRKYLKANGEYNYQVDVVGKDYSLTTNVEKQVLPYHGEVFCVSVPSSYVLTRYDGEICITGQCQNIPTLENDKYRLREAFIAPDENTDLIVVDYEALEMRLLACATVGTRAYPQGATDMIQIFLDRKDIHMGNAALMMGKKHGVTYEEIVAAKKMDKMIKEGKEPASKLTDRMLQCLKWRAQIKNIAFGLNYGMRENKLARDLNITKEEAIGLMDDYMSMHPAVKAFFSEAVEETEQTGFSYTILGRRRFHPAIHSRNKMDRFEEQRKATNNQIQGTAADVVRMAMLNVDARNLEYQYGVKMLLQVHDELVFECPKENLVEAKKEIKEAMEHPFWTDLKVPLTVSMGSGPSWGSAK